MKIELFAICHQKLSEKLTILENRLESLKDARDNETKSSAGDKFETGRAMMQAEIDKCNGQLFQVRQDKAKLQVLAKTSVEDQVIPGALVETNSGEYLITIGMGKILLDNKEYYGISAQSPIGKALLGKRVGDTYTFRNKESEILSIS